MDCVSCGGTIETIGHANGCPYVNRALCALIHGHPVPEVQTRETPPELYQVWD